MSFVESVSIGVENKELKALVEGIANTLKQHLPTDYKDSSISILYVVQNKRVLTPFSSVIFSFNIALLTLIGTYEF
jgi:hypothetical protein